MSHTDDAMTDHRQTWGLIPWVVNGRASDAERRIVEQHLAACNHCREEFDFQQQLHAALTQEHGSDIDPRPSLQRLWAQIDGNAKRDDKAEPPQPVQRTGALARWLAVAVVVESIGLTALSAALWSQSPLQTLAYRTLTTSQPAMPGASIRAVFSPTLSLKDLEALLGRSQLRIVNGPNEAGAYTLGPISPQDSATTRQALARLRADPGVRFAEPVASAYAPQ